MFNSNTKHFSGCEDMEQAQAIFKKLAFKFHPDTGGNDKDFREMVDEFQLFQRWIWNNAGNAKWGAEFKSTRSFEMSAETMERLKAVLRFHDVNTEIQGTWVWVSGNTRAYRDELKKMKFRWCPNKTAWSYHSEPYKRHHKRSFSMDDIRNLYGGKSMDQQPDEAVA